MRMQLLVSVKIQLYLDSCEQILFREKQIRDYEQLILLNRNKKNQIMLFGCNIGKHLIYQMITKIHACYLLFKQLKAFANFKFQFQHFNKPHPSKIQGQDFALTHPFCLAVADGVGGWNQRGVDSGKYSEQLCILANKLFKARFLFYSRNPKQLLIDSVQLNKEKGSSTFTILTLQNNFLNWAYIGDSLFILIRNGKILFQSQQQIHKFNTPYQVGSECGPASRAAQGKLQIHQKDLIILATDGLWDNLFFEQILQLSLDDNLSKNLCMKAYRKSLGFQKTPFSIKGQLKQRGKPDDITVITAIINKA